MTPLEHYRMTFYLTPARTAAEIEQAHHIRYLVYCREFGYESPPPETGEFEMDEYDPFAQHCLLIHKRSQRTVGCARLVFSDPQKGALSLPIWEHCGEAIDRDLFDPEAHPPEHIVEFSRMAIVEEFRRREKAEEQLLQDNSFQQSIAEERRYSNFPVIPTSLLLAPLAMLIESSAVYGLAMMEPKLERLLRKHGVRFTPIGRVIDYHGRRAPYLIHRDTIRPNLLPEIRELFDEIHQAFKGEIPKTANEF